MDSESPRPDRAAVNGATVPTTQTQPLGAVIAAVFWRSPQFTVAASALSSTGTLAVTALGAFLEDAWPDAGAIHSALDRDVRWLEPLWTSTIEGVAITSPALMRHAPGEAVWQRAAGRESGIVRTTERLGWMRSITTALSHVPEGAGTALETAFAASGGRVPAALAVPLAGFEATLTVLPVRFTLPS